MALVDEIDWNSLPAEPPEARWLALYDALNALPASPAEENRHKPTEWVIILETAGKHLKLSDPPKFDARWPDPLEAFHEDAFQFATELRTQIKLASSATIKSASVKLERSTRKKIIIQIESLRGMIGSSDLPDKQKKALERKLTDLHQIVIAERSDLKRLWGVLATIAAMVGGSTAFLAEAPAAIGTITMLVGHDIASEEEERKLLQPPDTPLGIEDHRATDDDIPF